MAVAGSLTYDTKLETKGFNDGLNKISSSTIAKGQLMADAFKGIANQIIGVVKTGVEYNATIEQLTTSFEVMTGSQEKAVELTEKLKEVGAKTPYELQGLAQTTQTLMQYGLTADEAYEATLNFGDIAQGSAEKMQSIALAYGQMSSAGKVNMQDIKQMINAGFNPLQAIAEMTGETMAEVTARYEENAISVEEVTEAMKFASSEGGKFYQSMDKQSQTLNGQISTLKDNWNELTGTIAKKFSDALKNDILPALNNILSNGDKIIQKITEIIPYLEAVGIVVLSWKVGGAIQGIVTGFQQAKVALSLFSLQAGKTNIAQAVLNGTLTVTEGIVALLTGKMTLAQLASAGLAKAQAVLNAVMSANPIALVVLAIGALIAIFVVLWNKCDGFREFWINLWEIVVDFVKGAIEKIKTVVLSIIDFIKNNWKEILVFLINPFAGIIAFLYKLNPQFKEWVDNLIASIKSWFGKVADIGKNIVTGIWNGITNAKDWLLNKIKSFASSITNGIKKFFGIKSPSKVMRDQVGQWLPKGIAVGIDANTDSALNSIDKMNDEIMNRMSQAVNMETAKASFNGISGSVSQILSANSVIQVENYNTLELDGEKVYENQQTISKNKNLQYGFGGASVK